MIKNLTEKLDYKANFQWIDIVSPTEEELNKVAVDFSLKNDSLLNCLTPNRLPNLQEENGYYFIILRAYDESCKKGEQVQAYTNKIVLFVSDYFLISIHRKEEPFLLQFAESIYKIDSYFKTHSSYELLLKIFRAVLLSFENPMHRNELSLDSIEEQRFINKSPEEIFNDIYYIKRLNSVIKRTLWQSNSIVQSLYEIIPEHSNTLKSLRECSDRLHFLAEELEITAQNIVSLHISIASYRTSEVMRTLAVFSVFFMPLTFIVGIYGMNFTKMPELNWQYGYPAVILLMIFISVLLHFWFKKKGWYQSNKN